MTVTVKHLPTLNLNGTSYDELTSQQEIVIEKINEAITAMSLAAPHGRDFQIDPDPHAFRMAQADHLQRMFKLITVRDVHAKILQHLVESHLENERMRGR
jgi:hypothetical protein